MDTKTVRDLMVPLSEYATVHMDASLYDAVIALEKAQEAFDQNKYRHRAILVYDQANKIVGKISQHDVLRALEPKYKEWGDQIALARFGYSRKFMSALFEKFDLWETPVADVCRKAGEYLVKDFMSVPKEGEYVEETASIIQGIHQLVMGHHQSLLVTRKATENIVGILRLVDVFKEITQEIKQCKV